MPGPQRGWFREMWERDLPKMKAMGVNTIRLFNLNPTTLQATVTVVNTQPGLYNITSPYGKEHINFLDYVDSVRGGAWRNVSLIVAFSLASR